MNEKEISNAIWCLDRNTLVHFIELSIEANSSLKNSSDVLTVPIQSMVDNTVFYELLWHKDQEQDNLFINICFMQPDKKDMTRAACVYHNGRILRWGVWALEVLSLLPSMMAVLFKQHGDFMLKGLVDRNLVDEYDDTGLSDVHFDVADQRLSKGLVTIYGETTVSKVLEIDRSGIPVENI